jgi:plastocyanin
MVVVLAACGGDGGDGGEGDGASSANADIVTKDFAFVPAELTATAGEEASFELANEDDTEHNITIKDLGVDEDVDAGGTTTVTVTADEAGDYDFFCEYHPDMTGTLKVK